MGSSPFFTGNQVFAKPSSTIQRQDKDSENKKPPTESPPTDAPAISDETSNGVTAPLFDYTLLRDPMFPRRFGLSPVGKSTLGPRKLSPSKLQLQLPPSPKKPSLLDNVVESEPFSDPNYPVIATNPRTESRQSAKDGTRYNLRGLPWLSYLSFTELAAPQHRLQWGQPTSSGRRDSYSAVRIGSEEWHLDYGLRSTMTTADTSPNQLSQVENQGVGFASLRLKYVVLSYWNDHGFWWWPLADGGDQGDTAGLSLGYLPTNGGLPLQGNWKLSSIIFNMRLASGIPVRGSEALQPDGRLVYQQVVNPEISRGDLNIATQLTTPKGHAVEFGFGISSGAFRNWVQSQIIHRSLDIPEFEADDHLEGYFWLKYEY